MGYDCTLHAIDERAIAAAISKLRGVPLATIERAVADGHFDRAGHLITEIAIARASRSGAHLEARGVALSLWDERLLGKMPWNLTGSVAKGPLAVAARRWPRAQLPLTFDGNDCTGVFVPSAQVPMLLAEVERRVAKRPKVATRRWAPLVRVLRVAATRQLAYWEATDLAVQLGHTAWLVEDSVQPARSIAADCGGSVVACDGDQLVITNRDEFATFVVDLTRWPPKIKRHAVFSDTGASSPTGRIVVSACDDAHTWPLQFKLYTLDGAKPRCVSPVLEDVHAVRFVGDTPIGFPHQPGARPRYLDGKPLRGLPRAVGYPAGRRSRAVAGDATHFADGTPLVIWDGSPYLTTATGFRRLAKADLRPEYRSSSSAPLDADHVIALRERRLIEISRTGKMTKRFPSADNVMAIYPGPEGAVVLVEGDNDDDHAAKLWWPAAKRYLGIDASELGGDRPDWIVWARRPRLLVARVGGRLVALDGDALVGRVREAER